MKTFFFEWWMNHFFCLVVFLVGSINYIFKNTIDSFLISTNFLAFFAPTLADEIRVKKTDLPVMPPVEMSNPIADDLDDISSDDNDSNYSKDTADDVEDEDDEDDLLADDEEDEMAADEATATGAGDDVNAEYDSGEDNYEEDGVDAYDQQGSSSGAKPSNKPSAKDDLKAGVSNGDAAGKVNGDLPMPPTTGQPTPDPYFTHFDPHYEHQSYKVSQKVSVFTCSGILFTKTK